jgi:tRNA (guanosine-2'-O-)-methyltransferase
VNTDQRSVILSKLGDVINDSRTALLEEVLDQRTRYLTVVLDDIHLAQNSSAVIRTCECIGIQDIHVIEDRNKHKTNRDVVKGSSKWIDLSRYENNNGRRECIERLKKLNYKIAVMTLNESNIALEELPVIEKLAICFGSEDTGLNKETESHADYKVQIPITGFTQSYNVSVSAGISLYYLMNKIKDTQQNWQLTSEQKEKLLIDWLSKSTPTGTALLDKYTEETKI